MQKNLFFNFLDTSLPLFVFVLILALLAGSYYLIIRKDLSWKKLKTYGAIAALAMLGTFTVSRLLVPVFNPESRAKLFDPEMARTLGLFNIKEDIIALASLVAIALLILIFFGRLEKASIHRQKLFASLFAILGLFSMVDIVFAFILNTS